jgi:hypothetical protein
MSDRQAERIWKVTLHQIEATVAAQLGPGRVAGNKQDECFSRQISMYLAKHIGGWSTRRSGDSTTAVTTLLCSTRSRRSNSWEN